MDKDTFQKLQGTFEVKVGLAEMLKGGVIIDVVNADQARIAEKAGAVAVAANVGDVGDQYGIEESINTLEVIQSIQKAVSIPVMAKCPIGHFVEAQILEALFVDFINESVLLIPADEEYFINKQAFKIPFICGCRDLGEALRRISEGAAMIHTHHYSRKGYLAEAVRTLRQIKSQIRSIVGLEDVVLMAEAKKLDAPYDMLKQVATMGKLPVPLFAAGGIVTPADAALMMQLGAESIFIDNSLFSAKDPLKSAKMIVYAVGHYKEPEVLARTSMGHFEPIKGEDINQLKKDEILAQRGW